MDFLDIIQKRHSANNFLKDIPITQADLKPIFEDVKLAPSAFNLQHTNYIVVTDPQLKEEIQKAAYGQHKVHTASAVIIVTGDTEAYKQTARLHQGMLALGIISEDHLNDLIQENSDFYEGRGEDFKREEAVRNASLSSMFFMLAAKNRGWDTCPMIGFDKDKVRELLNIQPEHEITLMITIGKEKESSRRMRGYRKPVDEFVRFL